MPRDWRPLEWIEMIKTQTAMGDPQRYPPSPSQSPSFRLAIIYCCDCEPIAEPGVLQRLVGALLVGKHLVTQCDVL